MVDANADATLARRRGRPALAARAEEAVKVYGSGPAAVRAVDGVTLDLAAAAFTAIMGPSGSGKSTLLYCLAGLEGLTRGRGAGPHQCFEGHSHRQGRPPDHPPAGTE